MSYFKIFSMMFTVCVIGMVIGVAYSSYISLAYSNEDHSLWDVIRLTVYLILGRMDK